MHNTEPWRFGHGERHIDVYADVSRQLRVADPDGREMLISCGAAVLTLRVALRYLGWLPRTRLFPDPAQPALVARVCWDENRIAADSGEREMFAAITARHTHPRICGRSPMTAELRRNLACRSLDHLSSGLAHHTARYLPQRVRHLGRPQIVTKGAETGP